MVIPKKETNQYLMMPKRQSDLESLPRDKMIEAQKAAAEDLAERIRAQFPEVVVFDIAWLVSGVWISIPEEKGKILKDELERTFDCVLIKNLDVEGIHSYKK